MVQQKVKEIFRKIGYDVKRCTIAQNQNVRLQKILELYNINLVFDIGANEGQFALELRSHSNYKGKIVSFEPLEDPYQKLIKNSLKDSLWTVAPRGAIGNTNGEIEINVADNTASSSILRMLKSHEDAAPHVKCNSKEKVRINKLDTIAKDYLSKQSNLFIKVDTQGYEEFVVNGGEETIKNTKVLQLELSFIELYEGQKLIVEMINKMKDLGFELWSIEPGFVNSSLGRMLQADVVFCKN